MTHKLESDIEREFASRVHQRGGLCLKWESPGWNGAPDRILLLPEGKSAFLEFKQPGERPRPLQVKRHHQLRELGYLVYVVDNVECLDNILKEVSQSCR